LAIPQLAAEVMAKGFSSDYDPANSGLDAGVIANEFCPMPQVHLLRDTTNARHRRRRLRLVSDAEAAVASYWEMSSLMLMTLRGLQSNVPFVVGVTRTNLPFLTWVRT
jgi:hypothetical protein